MRARALRDSCVVIAVVACGCAVEPGRMFYDDLDAGSDVRAMKVGSSGGEAGGPGDANVPPDDATTGEDGAIEAAAESGFPEASADQVAPPDEASVDARNNAPVEAGPPEAGPPEAGPDAPVEAGCGPTNTVTNCGACGAACDTSHSLGASCAGADCTYSGGCQSGFADCDKLANPKDLNGCETPTNTPAACGGCTACAAPSTSTAGATCTGTTCQYTCNPGYQDCNKLTAPDTDGCETATTTTANCGACGAACGNLHVMSNGASCVGGACQYNCANGYSNCNQAGSNTTGCECQTPSCCGSGCETTHNSGYPGISYYDCNPLVTSSSSSTVLVDQALEACAAFTGNKLDCQSNLVCKGLPALGPYVCNGVVSGTCTVCWSYGGTDLLKTEDCSCPPGNHYGNWN